MGGLVKNLRTCVQTVRLGDTVLPVTVNDGERTCYLCCPSAAYIDYAAVELDLLGLGPLARGAAMPLLAAGSLVLRACGIDRQIQLNNWLVATNPVPPMKAADLGRLVASLIVDRPLHAVVWRSLDEISDGGAIDLMRGSGWTLLPARMVYLFDCRSGRSPDQGRDERRDRSLLLSSGYEIVEGASFNTADFERAAELYVMLYLVKYTSLNPAYTPAFIEGMVLAGLLDLKGLRSPSGRLDGIVGFLDGGEVMTAPVVGYDTGVPASIGLYRMLMAIAFGRARSRSLLFNASAGAERFKRNRRAVAAIEYTAVYARHLGWRRRSALAVLRCILTGFAVPILERAVS